MLPITNKLIEKIVVEMAQNGGFSIDLTTGKYEFNSGFFVAIDNTEQTSPVYKGTQTRTFIKNFIVQNWDVLKLPHKVLGLWIENGKIYVDVSTLYDSEEAAYNIGKYAGQLAIYDNASKKTITIEQ